MSTLKIIRSIIKIINDKKKSTKATNIEDIGIIKRGKYVFLIILALATILFAALIIPPLKIPHKSIPLRANKGVRYY